MLTLDKSKLVFNLGRKDKLVPYLEKAIASSNAEWEFRHVEKQQDHHWHPSSHCTTLPSDLFLIATGNYEPRPFSPKVKKAFQVGHFWHQWLQYLVEHELKFATAEDIERHAVKSWGEGHYHSTAGSADLCDCTTPDWVGPVDFKTMNPRDYALAEKGIVSEWIADKYECQMNIYMDLFDREEWLLLCIQKATGDFCELVYKRNQPLIDHIYEKWKFVSTAVDEGLEIPVEEDKNWDLKPLLTGPIAS